MQFVKISNQRGKDMGFLEFIGGLIVFGLLWALLPRVTMIGLLCYILQTNNSSFGKNGWEALSLPILMLGGIIGGLILDIIERHNSWKTWFQ